MPDDSAQSCERKQMSTSGDDTDTTLLPLVPLTNPISPCFNRAQMKIFAAGATGAIGRPLKNRCNYDSSGLRLLAVAKYEGLPPWGLSTGFATWRRRDYVLYPAPLPHRQCF